MDTQRQKLSSKTSVDCAQRTFARLEAKSQESKLLECSLSLAPHVESDLGLIANKTATVLNPPQIEATIAVTTTTSSSTALPVTTVKSFGQAKHNSSPVNSIHHQTIVTSSVGVDLTKNSQPSLALSCSDSPFNIHAVTNAVASATTSITKTTNTNTTTTVGSSLLGGVAVIEGSLVQPSVVGKTTSALEEIGIEAQSAITGFTQSEPAHEVAYGHSQHSQQSSVEQQGAPFMQNQSTRAVGNTEHTTSGAGADIVLVGLGSALSKSSSEHSHGVEATHTDLGALTIQARHEAQARLPCSWRGDKSQRVSQCVALRGDGLVSRGSLSKAFPCAWLKRWSQVGLMALGLGCVSLVTGCSEQEQAQTSYTPSLAEAVFEVESIHPQFKNRERSFMLNGRVRAYTRADVRPQVDGIILQRLFTEGTHVDEGTPLYEIDPAPFQATLEHAQASYDRAVVQRKMAAKDYERFEQLYKRRSASEKEHDDALLAFELAQADEKLYKAALDTAQISLNYTKVSAPISGIIGVSSVTRGALVNANQSAPLATIIDLDKVYVDLEQSALEWRKLREGLLTGNIYLNDQAYDVSLYYQDSALYPHLGTLSLSEVIVDEVTGAVALRAEFDNPEHLLLPGMAVMCKLNGGVAQNIMTLPTQSVMRDPKGNAYVYTVQGDRAMQTPVKLGELYNDGWQILEGLDSTYEVIIAGVAALNHGSKVKVVRQDGIDLTVDVATSGQVKDPDAAVKAVNNPNVSSSGLGQSSANVPSM